MTFLNFSPLVLALMAGCAAPSAAPAPAESPSAAPIAANTPALSPMAEPAPASVLAPTTRCGANPQLKCGPPRPAKPELASASLLQILSTEDEGITIRALVGKRETGHYLVLERIARGETEGDADQVLLQEYIDLSSEMPGTAFVTLHQLEPDALSFSVESRPGGSAKSCQLVDLDAQPQLRCVIARGGRIRGPQNKQRGPG